MTTIAALEDRPITLYVSNLPADTVPDDLRSLLNDYGEFSVEMPNGSNGEPCRGFAWVKFASTEAASRAVYMLDGSEYRERLIHLQVVRYAKRRPSRPRAA